MSAESAHDRGLVQAALARWRRIVIVAHVRSDGDTLGSSAALQAAAELAGRDAKIVLAEDLPPRYRFLFPTRPPVCLTGADAPKRFAEMADQADGIVVVDTCAFEQLGPLAEAIRSRRAKVVVIDHHVTADNVGAAVWRDVSAAAAGVMVAELLCELGWPTNQTIVEALGSAIYSDTGWLRYSNTDARAMAAAGALIAAGLQPDELYARLYQTDRPERLKLLAAALASLTMHHGGRLAVMSLTRADFTRTGAAQTETEDMVNEGLRIGGVEVAVLLTEQPDGKVRGSLRSRKVVDVAALAATFGGGGHVRAAGLHCDQPLETVKQRIIDACADLLGR